MRVLVIIAALAGPTAAAPETLVAARTIRAETLLMPDDIATIAENVPGALDDIDAVVGMEARVSLYAGRPIRPGDVGPPAVIERNQIVRLVYSEGGLTIVTDARSLGRAGAGDTVRVMNLASRTTVTGSVTEDGTVIVAPRGAASLLP